MGMRPTSLHGCPVSIYWFPLKVLIFHVFVVSKYCLFSILKTSFTAVGSDITSATACEFNCGSLQDSGGGRLIYSS